MVISINNDDIKHYFKETKALLPLYGKPEKRFLGDLESSMREHVRVNPTTTRQELYDKYGKPPDVVSNYFEAIDTDRLQKRIRIVKWIRIILISILVFILTFGIYRSVLIYKDYKAAQDAHAVYEETIIEEE